jgi:hypothetical protein
VSPAAAQPPVVPMRALALALVLLLAVVGGVALWPESGATAGTSAAAGRAAVSAGAAAAVAAPVPAADAGAIEDLARGALAAMDEPARRAATLGACGPDVMLARAVPPAAIATGAGVAWTRLDATARAVCDRLLERSAAALLGARAGDELARLGTRAGLAFAWAGGARAEPFYVRVHGDHFALEWLRTADGALHGAWRDFTRDAGSPWLRDRALAARR